MNWWLEPCKQPNTEIKILAELRQSQLTKPSGSLGELEQVAVRLAALQGMNVQRLTTHGLQFLLVIME